MIRRYDYEHKDGMWVVIDNFPRHALLREMVKYPTEKEVKEAVASLNATRPIAPPPSATPEGFEDGDDTEIMDVPEEFVATADQPREDSVFRHMEQVKSRTVQLVQQLAHNIGRQQIIHTNRSTISVVPLWSDT